MSNCVDKQENPDQELDNLKDWKEKQIKFEAKRGRKGRLQRAAEHTRLSGVDFIENHFGLSDQYDRSDREKILKRVMIMARTQIPPRKISRADFDKWWLDPIIDKDRPAYDDPVKQVAYRQSEFIEELKFAFRGGGFEKTTATSDSDSDYIQLQTHSTNVPIDDSAYTLLAKHNKRITGIGYTNKKGILLHITRK